MTVLRVIACAGAFFAVIPVNIAVADAAEPVTYEVVSDDISVANVEYQDVSGRILHDAVPLPWRTDVTVGSVRAAPPSGSQVRADWRVDARPGRWVTVRIIYRGNVICQSTLDVGNATCYGVTPHIA